MATRLTLYLENDQIVTLQGVTDPTGVAVVGASIIGVLANSSGTVATLTFHDLAGQPGTYTAQIAASALAARGSYTLTVSGMCNGYALYAQIACTAQVRSL